MLVVEDEGPGVPENIKPKLFQTLITSEPPNSPPQGGLNRSRHIGQGVGLYLCRYFAERMGARVAFSSPPGEGARFMLILEGLSRG